MVTSEETTLEMEAESVEPSFPLSLRIVAWFLIVIGGLSFADTLWGLLSGRLNVDLLAFLFLVAGNGLLKRKRGWRTFVLVICWIVFVLLGACLGLIFVAPDTFYVSVGGMRQTAQEAPLLALLFIAVVGAIFGSIYGVLTRPHIRSLFLGAQKV